MNHNETTSEVPVDFLVSIILMHGRIYALSNKAFNYQYLPLTHKNKYILLIGNSSDWTSQANYL